MRQLIFVAACSGFAAAAVSPPIVLDGRTAAHAFVGIGGLSAGGTSRLLYDYAEPQRSDILDLLFRPQWGGSLSLLKVEIPGDAQSTDGAEPSHWHARGESVDCGRGYEGWLLAEAAARNPDIVTYALPWAAPRWVGDGHGDGKGFFSGDMIDYTLAWLSCVRNATEARGRRKDIDYLGCWNEKAWNGGPLDYVVSLRHALDAAGFAATRIVLPDNGWGPGPLQKLVEDAQANATYGNAFDAVGVHYACDWPNANITEALGKAYFASEDWSTAGDWSGTGCFGRLLNRNYVRMNMTATVAWSLAWGANAALPFDGAGLLLANTPWSGAYSGGVRAGSLDGPLFAAAHTTQFAVPGWRYLSVPGGGSGVLPPAAGNGSFVTLVPPTPGAHDFVLVIESLAGACLHCDAPATTDGVAVFATAGGLAGAGTPLHVWRSNSTAMFWRDADITIAADGTFAVPVPADTMVTVTTVAGAQHGVPAAPPQPPAPFPLPFADTFAGGGAADASPRFFSDQQGAFALRGGALRQVVPADPGPNRWTAEDVDPLTVVGDGSLLDVEASVTASWAPPDAGAPPNVTTYVQLCNRIAAYTGFKNGPPPGLCLLVNASGGWAARAGATLVASGSAPAGFDPTAPHRLTITADGATTAGTLDGAALFAGAPVGTHTAGGLVALGCGYHAASFTDFAIVAAAAARPV